MWAAGDNPAAELLLVVVWWCTRRDPTLVIKDQEQHSSERGMASSPATAVNILMPGKRVFSTVCSRPAVARQIRSLLVLRASQPARVTAACLTLTQRHSSTFSSSSTSTSASTSASASASAAASAFTSSPASASSSAASRRIPAKMAPSKSALEFLDFVDASPTRRSSPRNRSMPQRMNACVDDAPL